MKRLLIILMGVLLVGCGMKVRIQGIDMDLMKNRSWTKVAIGALTSVATHELAHYTVAEVKDLDPEFDGPTTVRYDGEDKWVARAGFLSQTGVGLNLNLFPATRDSDFTLGCNDVSAAQLFTYDIRNGDGGDFETIAQNEYLMFSGTATFNTLWTINNQNWKNPKYPYDDSEIESQREGNWEWGEKFVSIDEPMDRSGKKESPLGHWNKKLEESSGKSNIFYKTENTLAGAGGTGPLRY